MQRGTDPWQAAGFLGMSVKILIDTYGHHHPDYMKEAAEAITAKDRKSNVTVVETVVELRKLKEKREKSLSMIAGGPGRPIAAQAKQPLSRK